MAFNPFTTFQKNKKFWMAAILMVCMVVFVFCTGMKGDLGDRIIGMFTRSRGQTVAQIGGHTVGMTDLYDLKEQRNLINTYMKTCADIAFKKMSKEWFEIQKKQPGNNQERARALARLQAMRESIALRKSRNRYFESGVKFDELLEFKLWQAQADKMGVKLEPNHVTYLFRSEFYGRLSEEEEAMAAREARGAHRNVSEGKFQRALTEEFRVRMAQMAVLGSQPSAFFGREQKREQGFSPKFSFAEMPDEIRAPMTLAQLWDVYKSKRAEFEVTLLPIPIEEFVKSMPEPNDIQRRDFFNRYKDKPRDPSSDVSGLEFPAEIKIEYLMIDPTNGDEKNPSHDYLRQAHAKELMETMSPLIAWSPLQSPLAIVGRYLGSVEAEKVRLQKEYESLSQSQYRRAAPYGDPDVLTPILSWTAKRHPKEVARIVGEMVGMVNGATLSPLDTFGPWAELGAWAAKKDAPDVEAAMRAELNRRAARYTTVFAAGTSGFPLEMATLYDAMDKWEVRNEFPRFGERLAVHPLLPLEVVQPELRDIVAKRTAEQWAHRNINLIKEKLAQVSGDPQKFKRVLMQYVPELKITHGPLENKDAWYDQFTIDQAKELEPLKDAFRKSINSINWFEGRDLTPQKLLKPTDFPKMFFSGEDFAATGLYRAMPWPPMVMPNAVRAWKEEGDPRLIDRNTIKPELREEFKQFLIKEQDPNRPADRALDILFREAEKPILFWRTAESPAYRPEDYDKLGKDLEEKQEGLKKIELAKQDKNAKNLRELNKEYLSLKKQENILNEIQKRITIGWKLEEARKDKALPEAEKIARKLIERGRGMNVLLEESKKLNQNLITLRKVSEMHPEDMPGLKDYFPYTLPKDQTDQFVYPREDMAQQIVQLYDLKKPIKFEDDAADKSGIKKYDKLNEINEALYKLVKDDNPVQGKFVQILTNKPRTVFYVAVVTSPPFGDKFGQFFFQNSLKMAHYGMGGRDLFVARAQEEEAKLRRTEIVQDLGRVLGFQIDNPDARKSFDDKGAGD